MIVFILLNQSIKKIITELKINRKEIVLKESDLEESFVKGGGPGGQAVNKTNNAVWVRHIPSGFQVKVNKWILTDKLIIILLKLILLKCHKTRSLELNRHEARKLIIKELDIRANGDASKSATESLKRKERGRIRKKRSNEKYKEKDKDLSMSYDESKMNT